MSDFKPKFLKPAETSSFLDRSEPSAVETTSFIFNKHHSQSIQTQRQRLPIFNNRNHILYLLEKYQTLILIGGDWLRQKHSTSTIPHRAKWPAQIGVCEPRRVAAISLANRLADEMGALVQSDTVGYAVRFDTCYNNPKIKYMTEGILLREMMSDPLLKNYSAIMLDEVHERTLYTDILMGLLKKILKKRSELRLIVASATLDAKELQQFFNKNVTDDKKIDTSVILSVEGRQFPVDIHYVAEPVPCYVQASVDTVLKINSSKEQGDILVFLTGQEEVDRAVRLLNEHADLIEGANKKEKMFVLPMYGSLPYHEQLKVFKHAPAGYRKVVVATNIAETSITIPGVVHVIDCGFVKMRWFNTETHTDSLITLPISKASADQRAGRAGRMRAGKVYRLYTEEYASKLADSTPPEMVRSNLTFAVLQLKALGIRNILKFKFPSPPPLANLRSALEILYALDAIDIQGELTRPLGFHMSEFALDPLYSKVLLSSGEFGCSEEILTIISMLQVETVFAKPFKGASVIKARIQKRLFEVEEGDLITYLNEPTEKLLQNYNIPIVSCIRSTETIRKCLVKGLFPNAAYLHYSGVYKTVRGDIELNIHPDSVLYTIAQPQWVVFCEVVHTHKLYMRDVTVIQSDWLLELAPHFYYKTTICISVMGKATTSTFSLSISSANDFNRSLSICSLVSIILSCLPPINSQSRMVPSPEVDKSRPFTNVTFVTNSLCPKQKLTML
ncbi:hypothetical protein NQ317_010629 [Molorchus minor]|uniref:RNA helicase n=1 Tax=Molorchus minor TaxID=1323400 RepID=A0ABQ9JBI7_9CUCU|nr:hypothetical protein NQ317_010629 [Molorchus minor]